MDSTKDRSLDPITLITPGSHNGANADREGVVPHEIKQLLHGNEMIPPYDSKLIVFEDAAELCSSRCDAIADNVCDGNSEMSCKSTITGSSRCSLSIRCHHHYHRQFKMLARHQKSTDSATESSRTGGVASADETRDEEQQGTREDSLNRVAHGSTRNRISAANSNEETQNMNGNGNGPSKENPDISDTTTDSSSDSYGAVTLIIPGTHDDKEEEIRQLLGNEIIPPDDSKTIAFEDTAELCTSRCNAIFFHNLCYVNREMSCKSNITGKSRCSLSIRCDKSSDSVTESATTGGVASDDMTTVSMWRNSNQIVGRSGSTVDRIGGASSIVFRDGIHLSLCQSINPINL